MNCNSYIQSIRQDIAEMTKKILVVEDNPVALKLVSEILKRKGHSVKTAEDGLSALNILERYVPDIIFIDLLIPKIDGEMLCKIIRGQTRLEASYLIILSGIATEAGIDLTSLGADACIAKGKNISVHVDTVIEKINNGTLRQDKDKTYGYRDIAPRDATIGLLRSKEHLEVIIDNLADGLVETTCDGTIIYVNPAAEIFLADSSKHILGKQFFTYFPEEHRQCLLPLFENALNGQKQTDESEPIQLKERFLTLKIFSLSQRSEPSCLVLMHDITERKRLTDQLEALSKTDQLTGAYNRRAFEDFFTKELNAAVRYDGCFSLILIDIDYFKRHNDTFGHNVGDIVLKEVVNVMNKQTRQVDFLFRWGGDEFVILLPRIGLEDTLVIAERIRSTIENWDFSAPASITVSLGVSSFQLGDDANSMINRADVALYRSKHDGRNRVSVGIS